MKSQSLLPALFALLRMTLAVSPPTCDDNFNPYHTTFVINGEEYLDPRDIPPQDSAFVTNFNNYLEILSAKSYVDTIAQRVSLPAMWDVYDEIKGWEEGKLFLPIPLASTIVFYEYVTKHRFHCAANNVELLHMLAKIYEIKPLDRGLVPLLDDYDLDASDELELETGIAAKNIASTKDAAGDMPIETQAQIEITTEKEEVPQPISELVDFYYEDKQYGSRPSTHLNEIADTPQEGYKSQIPGSMVDPEAEESPVYLGAMQYLNWGKAEGLYARRMMMTEELKQFQSVLSYSGVDAEIRRNLLAVSSAWSWLDASLLQFRDNMKNFASVRDFRTEAFDKAKIEQRLVFWVQADTARNFNMRQMRERMRRQAQGPQIK
ncbi:hypothetical protein TWF694_011524 [Orbilia ellipsospora]|uniref:Uncharacterized protein n=1 Tax=Orbilia ellipsospora TaxID=2528407 RepID=A0AAV9XBP8_9PEZI